MAKYIDENLASKAADNGVKIGEVPPSRESKGSFSELYFYENELYSVVFSDAQDCWVSCGEIVEESEMHLYTINIEETKILLEKVKS